MVRKRKSLGDTSEAILVRNSGDPPNPNNSFSTEAASNVSNSHLISHDINNCLVCQKVLLNDINCIQCLFCDCWSHIGCAKILIKIFNILLSFGSNIEWICNKCVGMKTECKNKKLDNSVNKDVFGDLITSFI